MAWKAANRACSLTWRTEVLTEGKQREQQQLPCAFFVLSPLRQPLPSLVAGPLLSFDRVQLVPAQPSPSRSSLFCPSLSVTSPSPVAVPLRVRWLPVQP